MTSEQEKKLGKMDDWLKKRYSYNPEKHERLKQDCQSFINAITENCNSMNESLGITKITVNKSAAKIEISQKTNLNKCFDQEFEKQKKKMMDDLDVYRAPIHSVEFSQYISYKPEADQIRINDVLEYKAWNSLKGEFFEWFILTSLLRDFFDFDHGGVTELRMGSNEEPVRIKISDRPLYLWFQASIKSYSGLSTIPDILVTNDNNKPSRRNIEGLIECKNQSSVGALAIRSLFAQAWDVLPHWALLVSFPPISETNGKACRKLGIDIHSDFSDDSSFNSQLPQKIIEVVERGFFRQKNEAELHNKYRR